MTKKLATSLILLPTAVGVLLSANPAQAQAATSAKCRIIQSETVGGYQWARLHIRRVCSDSISHGVAGSAQLTARTIIVRYSERRTSTRQLQKATVHELTHEVEFWTTDANRAKLYSYLGIRNHPSYFGFNDAYYYNGTMTAWRQSPRERLAESVTNCTFGSPNHTGLQLVAKQQCKAFLKDFRQALAASS